MGVGDQARFNHRDAPAVALAREFAGGRIGIVTCARFRLFSDYATRRRLSGRKEHARGGRVGASRPRFPPWVHLVRHGLGLSPRSSPTLPSSDMSTVRRLPCGARVVLKASRVAVAEQNSYGFEVHGTTGALFWDFRRMGESGVSGGSVPGRAGQQAVRGARSG